ncbi:MAG: hypothetical protein LBR80_01915 [Deltaproteobacteria bacterium]|nr:hypothetical protein [Deltaproteobacteria bacterium]
MTEKARERHGQHAFGDNRRRDAATSVGRSRSAWASELLTEDGRLRSTAWRGHDTDLTTFRRSQDDAVAPAAPSHPACGTASERLARPAHPKPAFLIRDERRSVTGLQPGGTARATGADPTVRDVPGSLQELHCDTANLRNLAGGKA